MRLRGDDGPEAPLLITGRYGAGRVAVFASSVTQVSSANQPMWGNLVGWLTTPPAAASTSVPLDVVIAPQASLDSSGNRCLVVTVHNPSDSPAKGTVLARFLTWEAAMVSDGQAEFTLAPQASATVLIPFPGTGPTGYQALDFQSAYVVRVGVLFVG